MLDPKVREIIEHLTSVRGDLLAVQDNEYRYTEFNQAYADEFESVWGVKLEVGTDMREALAPWPEQLKNAVSLWERAHNGEKFQVEMAFGRDGEKERSYRLYFQPMFDENGHCQHASHILRDITHEKIETALATSESRFRALADNIPQLAWMAEPDGNIYWYNQRWFDFTGLGLEEAAGMGWTQVHHPEHVDRVVAAFKQALQEGEGFEDTFPLRSKAGVYHWFLTRALPIRDEEGTISAWFGTNTDITRQRQVEEDLRIAHKRKDEYLATLGHELRNPLAAIRTASEVIASRSEKDSAIEQASAVLLRQVNHAVGLVDGLLEVSRLALGKVSVNCASHNITQLCQQVLSDRVSLFEACGLKLERDLPDEQLWAWFDPVRAIQVLDNVLTNALKFTPAPGRISLSLQERQGDILIEVSDTGVGISEEALAEIFEPLHQEIADQHLSSGGLGLGLALCRTLMELQGGSIEAKSEGRSRGATFEIRFRKSEAGEPVHVPAAAQMPARRRILVVEDNRDSADMLSLMLETLGHDVVVAHDGKTALTQLGESSFDVVLSDIGLPGMSGHELARKIRSQERFSALPLVALSGYGQPSDKERSRKAGFNRHLVKPIGLDALIEVLRDAGQV